MDDAGRLMQDFSVRRYGRIGMYAGLVLSGTLLIIDPSELTTEQVSAWIDKAWAVSMLVSALGCLVGSITDRWFGEYAFIPLLASVIMFYGLSALAGAGGSLTLVAFGLLLISFGLGLWARWQDVRTVKKAASIMGDENGGG